MTKHPLLRGLATADVLKQSQYVRAALTMYCILNKTSRNLACKTGYAFVSQNVEQAPEYNLEFARGGSRDRFRTI